MDSLSRFCKGKLTKACKTVCLVYISGVVATMPCGALGISL